MTAERRSEVGIDLALGYEPAPEPTAETPFCMLVIGDFAGEAARAPLRERRALRFDRDDVDAALAHLSPLIQTTSAAGAAALSFRSIDDFHPDHLFASLPLFAELRELRAGLLDARTFPAAARELTGGAAPPPPPAASGGSLLDRMLEEAVGPGEPTSPAARAAAPVDDLAAFVRQVVRKHLVADPDPRQAELVRGVDAAVTTQLRALLHDPPFRALEAAWRTVERLARRVETGTSLRLYLLDVSAAELTAALADQPDGAAAGFAELLAGVGATLPDGGRWSSLVVLRAFGEDEWDHGRLARLALIARTLGAPAFVDASPSLAGLESWAELPPPRTWAAAGSATLASLRASPAAAWVCAAAPRVLLRAPYGEEGEPIGSFGFEELAEDAGHEAFLWGSGGAVCALLVAQAFALQGWSMRPGAVPELDGLPIYLHRGDRGAGIVPGAETLLTEDAADALLERGITPIATMRGSDTVRMVRLQSLASPPTALAGPWNG